MGQIETLNKKDQHGKIVFSFFGPPGSGKGTLAERLAKELGFEVLSTGNLCRKHVSLGTEFGKKLDFYLKKGSLIPDELITQMVKDWLEPIVKNQGTVILDGYPRTSGQANSFFDILKEVAPDYCYRVILVELSDDDIVKRLSSRRVCGNKDCQLVYMPSYQHDTCGTCGDVLVKRDDDREEVIRERLKLYPAYRDLLLDFYALKNQSIEVLAVAGMSPDQVFHTFRALL